MLETQSTKAIAVGESNNAGVWERNQPPEANRRYGDFTAFFPKYAFLGIF